MKSNRFETIAIRTQLEKTLHKEHSTPVFLTSSFTFDSAEEGAALFKGEQSGNIYSRYSNPSVDEFAKKLTLLEECEDGVATASGMSAVFTSMVAHLKQGDHIVASSAIFGNTRQVITSMLPDMGVSHTFVDVDDNDSWQAAIQSNTRLVYVETPSNPTLKTADLAYLRQLCTQHNLIYLVDNCFATPYLQKPARFGADLVIHSATKYIDGQGRVLGGAILGKKEFVEPCYQYLKRMGASLSPFNAWVLSKSLETLAVRMDRHCDNAEKVADFLRTHPAVKKVIYPGLQDYPQRELSKTQMKRGGGLVGCELHGGIKEGAQFLNGLKMISLTANLGDVRTIATHPASTTHSKLTEEERRSVDITPGYLRFSVGLEWCDDIIDDIDQSLSRLI